MDVPICDICKEVLRGKSYIYTISEKHISNTLKYMENSDDFEEVANAYKRDVYTQVKKTEQRDMCVKCKRIFDFLCSIRRNKLKNLESAVEKLFETDKPTKEKVKPKKTYCKCLVSLDWGDLKDGIPNGMCYYCEKKLKT